MKRKKERIEALRKEEELERENARVLARERVLRDFERGQLTVSRPESSLDEKDRDACKNFPTDSSCCIYTETHSQGCQAQV
jgi:hypothetical protein